MVRPDSGDPAETCCSILKHLGKLALRDLLRFFSYRNCIELSRETQDSVGAVQGSLAFVGIV